jgi:predicted nucleic acid-binding protein
VIVLDTNILSELTRRHPHQGVLSWLDSVPATESRDRTQAVITAYESGFISPREASN